MRIDRSVASLGMRSTKVSYDPQAAAMEASGRVRLLAMISIFELFKIGVGPSSSHTVGPMKIAAAFANGLVETGAIGRVATVDVALLGSLAFTGKGHATDKA